MNASRRLFDTLLHCSYQAKRARGCATASSTLQNLMRDRSNQLMRRRDRDAALVKTQFDAAWSHDTIPLHIDDL